MAIVQLSDFFTMIKKDNRISTSHISIYMALFERWNQNDFKNPIYFKRCKLMEMAKIRGVATFHRCIKDLAEFGYIEYMPSFYSKIPSQVHLL
ncbi:MAG: hypothetical protein NVSMB67_30110 [Flavisolibacter sp.]